MIMFSLVVTNLFFFTKPKLMYMYMYLQFGVKKIWKIAKKTSFDTPVNMLGEFHLSYIMTTILKAESDEPM